eukprot:926404_1
MAAQLVFLHNCVDSGLLHSKLKTHILLNDLNPNKESPAVRPLTQSYLSDDTVFALCRQHLVCGDRNIIEVIAKNDTIMHWTDGFILVVFSSSIQQTITVRLGYGNKKNRGDGPNEMGNNLLVIALGSS